MPDADLWHPLRPLGETDGRRLDRALGSLPVEEVEACIGQIAGRAASPDASSSDAPRQAALLAGRFALAQRGGDALSRAEGLAIAAGQAFIRLGDARAVAFLEVERAALLASEKTRLDEAGLIADALPTPKDDPTLSSAVFRVRGAIARAHADLRGSLLHLERARRSAEESGNPREILRASNTLGTSYAALGVAGLARDALEGARELAEIHGHRQSAGIAAGQLAVLSLDAGKPRQAVRHLEAQRAICERLGDVHGLSRSLALLVEAYSSCHEPARARAMAELARGLYTRSPGPWTRLQAVMATLYEAEDALSSGDEIRARELLASCAEERGSDDPALRVARAREAFVQLWLTLRDEGGDARSAIEGAFSHLRRSPRPTWVERALLLGVQVAKARGCPELVPALAVRSASLLEIRASAAAGALASLRELSPSSAVARAMALGRDLVMRSRLSLAPFGAFPAEVVVVEVDDSPGALDGAVAGFQNPDRPGEQPDGLLMCFEGHRRAVVAAPDEASAERGAQVALRAEGVSSVRRSRGLVRVTDDPSVGLSLCVR